MQEAAFNVLVVDDERETLDLIGDFLTEQQFKVRCADNAQEALEIVRTSGVGIAILDIHMPGMDGRELLRAIKQIQPGTQVIMITGYGTIQDAVVCMQLGASDFITKPLIMDHLLLRIDRLLAEARLREEAELAAYYRELARTDELTGLFNFRHLSLSLKLEVERHLRYGRTLSLAMIDIDDFKQYNDSQGHEAGNELLRGLARVLTHNTRNCDILGRYGGEEFVILFPETGLDEAKVVAQRIGEAVAKTLPITVTIGLADLNDRTRAEGQLLEAADQAMYWGKTHGKNQIVLNCPESPLGQ
ncbi:MAG: Response regulator PleD [Deltaproteobacteria bacterium ADurb.Bin510]|nr:MAG: Response regulator PleD [Deltaproteobacteria bacterium ADurb.Bin510]